MTIHYDEINFRMSPTTLAEKKAILAELRTKHAGDLQQASVTLQGDPEAYNFAALSPDFEALQVQIRRLEFEIANAVVMELTPDSLCTVVSVGHIVTIQLQEKDGPLSIETYQLVHPKDANVNSGKLNCLAPMARAMMGKHQNEQFTWEMGGESFFATIISIQCPSPQGV